jgi:hypothetical protein
MATAAIYHAWALDVLERTVPADRLQDRLGVVVPRRQGPPVTCQPPKRALCPITILSAKSIPSEVFTEHRTKS